MFSSRDSIQFRRRGIVRNACFWQEKARRAELEEKGLTERYHALQTIWIRPVAKKARQLNRRVEVISDANEDVRPLWKRTPYFAVSGK